MWLRNPRQNSDKFAYFARKFLFNYRRPPAFHSTCVVAKRGSNVPFIVEHLPFHFTCIVAKLQQIEQIAASPPPLLVSSRNWALGGGAFHFTNIVAKPGGVRFVGTSL
jgi:hypothetical protein